MLFELQILSLIHWTNNPISVTAF